MVPMGGLEPPRPKATDFESVVSTISPHRLEHFVIADEIIVCSFLIINEIGR